MPKALGTGSSYRQTDFTSTLDQSKLPVLMELLFFHTQPVWSAFCTRRKILRFDDFSQHTVHTVLAATTLEARRASPDPAAGRVSAKSVDRIFFTVDPKITTNSGQNSGKIRNSVQFSSSFSSSAREKRVCGSKQKLRSRRIRVENYNSCCIFLFCYTKL